MHSVMKSLLRLSSKHSFLRANSCFSINQLQSMKMFSVNSHIVRFGSCIGKNYKTPNVFVSSLFGLERVSCKYISLKVDTNENGVEAVKPQNVARERKSGIVHHALTYDDAFEKPANNFKVKQTNFSTVADPTDLLSRLKQITRKSERDVANINEICQQLCDMELNFSVKSYVDILYCLSVLNVPNENLISKSLKNISILIEDIYKPVPLITHTLRSMANLLYRDTDTLDVIIKWLHKMNPETKGSGVVDAIHALAVLNYFPAEADILLNCHLKSDSAEHSSTLKYLDFVWAVSLLDRGEQNLIESVLSPNFRKQLECVLGSANRNSITLKLFNIYCFATMRKMNLEVKVNTGLYSVENPWFRYAKEQRRRDSVVRSVIDGLSHLLPHRTFNTFISSPSGCIIDAVCFFDVEGRPVTELEFVKNRNGFKLAVITLGFKDLCFPKKLFPNGIFDFHRRFLEESYYKVLFIPFSEFPMQENLKLKTEYLKGKINSIFPNFE